MKPLDLADKYEPLSYQDDEPTVKVNMEAILPKVVIEGDTDEWDDPTLPSARTPVFHQEKTYPGVGLALCLGTGLLFWGTVFYFIFR